MKGRKPVPTRIKELRGTTRPSRTNPAEAEFRVPYRMLTAPAHLAPEAKKVWRDVGRMLLVAGLFSVVDKFALGMFCTAAGRWIQAEETIQKTGPVLRSDKGNFYQNPWLAVSNRAWDQMKSMLSEFGLSPAERTRVQAHKGGKEPSLGDSLEAFFASTGTEEAIGDQEPDGSAQGSGKRADA